MTHDLSSENIETHLNCEASKIAWRELQGFFAAGKVIAVHVELDLIQVAVCLCNDDVKKVEQWTKVNRVAPVSDEQALRWYEQDAELWALVVKPWVLVQEKR